MYSEPFKRDWKERETLCGATKMVADEIARD